MANALLRILARARRGAVRGWGPDNPVGLAPEADASLRAAGVTRPYGSSGTPLQAFNEILLNGGAAGLDLAGKAATGAYGGAVGAAAGIAQEVGVPRLEALERDLMAMPEALAGGLGGLGGVSAKATTAQAYQAGQRSSQRFRPGALGSPNLGWVGPEIEAASNGRFRQAPIRMREGISGADGYGAAHISPGKHERAQTLGYSDGFDLIEDVARHHDVVVEQANGRLMLVKQDGQNRYIIAEFKDGGWRRAIGLADDHYGVTTGFPDGRRQSDRGNTSLRRAIEGGGRKLFEK